MRLCIEWTLVPGELPQCQKKPTVEDDNYSASVMM